MRERPDKPRSDGLTVVADRGYGLNQVSDLLAGSQSYIDWFKFATGSWRLLEQNFLIQKIALLKAHQIKVFFAGDASEAAYLQGVSGDYFREIFQLGGDAVEVSSAQVLMPVEDKLSLISQAHDEGLEVIAEVGRKGKTLRPLVFEDLSREIKTLLSVNPFKVLIQAEGITEDVDDPNFELVKNLVEEFGSEILIFQAKDQAIMEAYIQNFGLDLNFDVEIGDVLPLELLRRGIRKKALAGLSKT